MTQLLDDSLRSFSDFSVWVQALKLVLVMANFLFHLRSMEDTVCLENLIAA